jgi:hypothetical protein
VLWLLAFGFYLALGLLLALLSCSWLLLLGGANVGISISSSALLAPNQKIFQL